MKINDQLISAKINFLKRKVQILNKFIFTIPILLFLITQSTLAQPNTLPEFIGGLNIANFQSCEKKVSDACNFKSTYDEYQQCVNKITRIDSCKQFVALTKKVGFSIKSNFDVIKSYNNGNVYLLHLMRWGANYPGDYYLINSQGELVQVTSYDFIKSIDIKSAPNYAVIINAYPKAEVWGIVDQLPQTQTLPDNGIRFIFRYEMLNGCHACAIAGYANIALDFAKDGKFIGSKLISLEEKKPVQS